MSHTTDSMTFEIFEGFSFSSLLLCPGHGDIQKMSYTAQRQTDPSLKKNFLKQLWTAWSNDLIWSLFTVLTGRFSTTLTANEVMNWLTRL